LAPSFDSNFRYLTALLMPRMSHQLKGVPVFTRIRISLVRERLNCAGRSLGDGIFFVKDRHLWTGPDLELLPFFGTKKKNAEGITGQKISGAPVSFFLHLGWGRNFFFLLRTTLKLRP
jgi:hypothetical protein